MGKVLGALVALALVICVVGCDPAPPKDNSNVVPPPAPPPPGGAQSK
jgi:hypothetical protein